MDAKEVLKGVIGSGRIPHAILLENAPEQAAYDIARAAVCSSDEPPCMVCSDCIKADAHTHPDIAVRRPDKNGRYSIDFVRGDILSDAYILPNEAKRKVYIIFEADTLSVKCQNALLKTLEEPPEYAVFILCCPSRENLLETVLSRCVAFTFNEAGDAHIDDGSEALELIYTAVFSDELTLLDLMQKYSKAVDAQAVAENALNVLRDVYIARLTPGIEPTDDKTAALIKRLSILSVMRMIDAVRRYLQRIEGNGNLPLITTIFCADLKRAL